MTPAALFTLMDRFVQDPSVLEQMQDPGAVRMKKNGKPLPDLPWSHFLCSRPAWFPPNCFLWSDEPFPSPKDMRSGMVYMRLYWMTEASDVGLGRSNLALADIPPCDIPWTGDSEDMLLKKKQAQQ